MERKTITKVWPTTKEALELKKHVAVIHSNNKLTLLQRKIANALLFNAYHELQESDEHAIHIGKLCELIGYDSNDHKSIKKALVNLISTVLEWNLIDGERLEIEGAWNASSIIAGATIEGAMCTYSYSPQMRKLLYRPNVYGRLDMLVQARFQSTYGLALYENCNRFQDIGQTPWFDIAKFRKLMGVEDSKYKIFRDFKTRVLDKAVEEVNKYSSLMISPQLRKQNRKVTSIQFIIKKSDIGFSIHTAKDYEEERQYSENNKLISQLSSHFNLTEKQALETLKRYEVAYIRQKIDFVQSSPNYKKGRIKNLARYLLSALKNNYQSAQKAAITKDTPQLQASEQPSNQVVRDVIKLTAFRRYQEKQLYNLFTELPELLQAEVLIKFEKYLTGMYQQVYFRDGLKNLLIQEQLFEYLKKINHDLTLKLDSYEKWSVKN